MEKLDRIQQLHQLLVSHRQPVSLRALAEKMECTPKTVRRLIEVLQSYFSAPIDFIQGKGWTYVSKPGENVQLPGLWLTAEELQSMALLLHVLDSFGNGLLQHELKPVTKEIYTLLRSRKIKPETLMGRIKVLSLGQRNTPDSTLLHVGDALMKGQQITIQYADFDSKVSTRTISPQNLVYYRDNWYLDAWCHKRQALRIFSLARIDRILHRDKPAPALHIPDTEREQYFSSGYGIFAGPATQTATLRFSPGIAREIARQEWHPQQQGCWDGSDYVLSLPYSNETELLRDVMRYVPDVVVEGPETLRQNLKDRLSKGLLGYGEKPKTTG